MAAAVQSPEESGAMLVFWANGTLDHDERRRVDARIADDAALRAEADALLQVHETVQAEDAETSPGDFGLARLMRQIASEEPAAPARWRTVAPWSVAIAAAMAMAVVSYDAYAPRQGDYIQASGDAGNTPSITVAFQPTASEAEIRALLQVNGLVIVDGPSALGLYRVAGGPDADLEALADVIGARSDIVQSASPPQ